MDNEWGDFGVDGNSSGELDIFGGSGEMELDPINSGAPSEVNFGNSGFDTPAQNQSQQNSNESINKKKVLIASCIAGIVLLTVVLFIWSLSRGDKQQVDDASSGQVEVQQTQTQQVQTQPAQTQPAQQVQKPVVQPVNKEPQWVEVDPSEYLKDIQTEQGYFTVNSIKTMAMLKGKEKGNYLRAILIGNITGMQGEYELVIPVTSVEKVSIGSVIDVEYKYINVKDSKIIVDIK